MSLKKTAEITSPHAAFVAAGWEWRVLKCYKAPKSEAKDPYARWYCAVQSPYTMGSWEYGDVYVNDVPKNPRFLTEEFAEAYADRDYVRYYLETKEAV